MIAGIDEVGRGALFGPVVAAAVALTPEASDALKQLGVKDSKRLTARRREALVPAIKNYAGGVAIGVASVREIDRLNILQASLLAMKRAYAHLAPCPSHCLIDGNQTIPSLDVPQTAIVRGDQTEVAIAAASVIAKVWRDALIVRLDRRYPGYDLAANKGYGTPKHREALIQLGLSRQHRRSFRKGSQAEPLLQSPTVQHQLSL